MFLKIIQNTKLLELKLLCFIDSEKINGDEEAETIVIQSYRRNIHNNIKDN